MSNLTVTAQFTKLSGQPATGLTLADINLYLVSINKSTGATANIWNPQNPSAEAGLGSYLKIYALADFETYDYIARAQYTGATVLDSNYAYSGVANNPADSAQALLDYTDGVEAGLTPRGLFRLAGAALAGVLSGAGTLNILIRNAVANSKTRINATVDANGNRTVVNTDVS